MREKKVSKNSGGFLKFRQRQEFFAWSFVALPLALLLISWIFVNGQTVLLAFQHDIDGWGFTNFIDLYESLTNPYLEGGIPGVIKNTLLYFVCQEFIGVPLSLFVSYFIYKQVRGYKTFRVIFYLPSIIPQMVFVTAFSQIIMPGGVFERIVDFFGGELPLKGVLWTSETSKPTLIVYQLLTAAAGNILFYSAFSRIPPELVEAAELDGITLIKEFFYIDFPLILPTFSMTLLLDVANILACSPPILLFNIPPNTSTVSFWFFNEVYLGGVFGIGKYGYMSALGICFTLLNLPIVLFVRWLAEKVDVDY